MSNDAHPLESIPEGERQAIEDLVALQRRLMEASKPIRRGQHAKSHGCVRAEFQVREDVPDELRAGVFAKPVSFPAWVRFSNGFSPDDRAPDVHGVGVKLMSVPGEKILTDQSNADTQDFLLADHPVFFAPTVRSATDFFSEKVSYDMKGVPPAEAFGELAEKYPKITPLFLAFVRPADPSPLLTTYWSEVASLCGGGAVKYMVRPIGDNGSNATPTDSENFLRAAMVQHLTTEEKPAAFEFCVQQQTDPPSMPVEDPTIEWNSPWIPVAGLKIAPQTFDTAERESFAEYLTFTPWHSLPAHRPLGGISRARKAVYAMSSQLRHEAAGQPQSEPSAGTPG